MNDRNKQVAIAYDDKGKCIQLSLVKAINEQEYKKLLNEKHEHESKLEQHDKEISQKLNDHNKQLVNLRARDLFVAKAQYDKFVDRGLLDENKEFDKKFYDYVFENKPLNQDEYPEDFKKILEKVVNL